MPPRRSPSTRATPPGLNRLWFAEGISGFGNFITLYALPVIVVVDLGGGAAQTGLLSTARWLPYLVAGVIVGAIVDRYRRKPVMVGTDLLRAVLLSCIPLLWALDVLSLGALLLVVLLYAAASLVNDAASQSFMPRLVPTAYLQRAHARIDGTDAVAQTAGPALAGVLVRLVGAPFVVLLDAITFVVAALTVRTIPIDEPPPDTSDRPGLRKEIGEGLRWIYRGRRLRDLALATHVWFAGQAVVGALLAPYALTELGLSAIAFGFVTAALGVGGVVGAACSTALGRWLGTGGAIIASHLASVTGTVVMLLAIIPGGTTIAAVLLGTGQVLHGFGLTASNSHEMAYRQSITPDGLQARTNTTMRSLNRAVVVVLAPIAGLLADAFGLPVVLIGGTAFFALAAVLLVLSPLRTARIVSGD